MKTYSFGCYEKEDKELELNGRKFKIKGKAPLSVLLASMDYAEDLKENGAKAFKNIIQALLPVFNVYQKITFEELSELISVEEIPAVMNVILDGIDPVETKKTIDGIIESGQKKSTTDTSPNQLTPSA